MARKFRTSFLDMNTQGILEVTNMLEKLPHDVMPRVVGSTLNDLAFDAKGFKGRTGSIEMATRNAATYDRANKGFYKKITSVDLADKKGSIKQQESEAGISRRAPGLDKTAEGLARFNLGGGKQQDFNPVDDNRAGKKRSRLMGGSAQSKTRVGGRVAMKEIAGKKASDFIKYKKGNKAKYVAAAIKAYETKKFLLIEDARDRGLLVKVTYVDKPDREIVNINSVVYGYYSQGRVLRMRPSRFIEKSAKLTMRKGKKFFEANAKFRMKQAGWV